MTLNLLTRRYFGWLYGFLGKKKHSYYLSLYLDNQITGGEWYPKKTFMTTLTVEEFMSWAQSLLLGALFPTHNYMGQELHDFNKKCMVDNGPLRVGASRWMWPSRAMFTV